MMRMCLVLACGLLTACQFLPSVPHLPKSEFLTQKTQSIHQAIDTHSDGLSGYYTLATGADAFASRSILTDTAKHTIDVQYYIWHDDETGHLMLQSLWQAAERGVLIRLLLDDLNGSVTLDKHLSAFAKHPNIAVRVVNPFTYRRYKFLSYLTSLRRINIRMHNKSMTFDSHTSIIGGRNIGDEYLNNYQDVHFADLDVLLTGEVVDEITQSFDEYWQSAHAYDIETLASYHKEALVFDGKYDTARHRELMNGSTIVEALSHQNVPYRFVAMKFLADDALKLHKNKKHHNKQGYLVHQLREELAKPKERLSIISPYFVPTKEGVQALMALANDGVSISILTNSLESTDVKIVHAGYGHWREALLSAGIRLYELNAAQTPPLTSSLHAKAFAVDDDKIFIGSYNIDPRSANINTELGVVIYDKDLAYQLHHALGNTSESDDGLLRHAYRLHLVGGKLQWHTLQDDRLVILEREPNTSTLKKLSVDVASLLPIDGFL